MNIIAILTALGVLAVWLRKRVRLAFNNATAELSTQLSRADDELKGQVNDLNKLIHTLTTETRRAHERLDRHLETHGLNSPAEATR